jgi:hypothetical protein
MKIKDEVFTPDNHVPVPDVNDCGQIGGETEKAEGKAKYQAPRTL